MGDYAYGIWSWGNNTVITNNGSISTLGLSADGIHSGGAKAIITNSGIISTKGDNANGIRSSGPNDVITNSGSISTAGIDAYGISSYEANAAITNSGTISTSGLNVTPGILSQGANTAITNSGSISTSGLNSPGIGSGGANATIINSGSILTSGEHAYGIGSVGDNTTLTHSGNIKVTGMNAVGIGVIGAGNNTLTVSGSVTATGNATQAIVGGDGNEVLNLLPGARILGAVDLGAGANTANLFASAMPSATLVIGSSGTLAVNVNSGKGLAFASGSTVHFADTTNITASQATMGTLSSQIAQSVNRQLNRAQALPQPVQVASAGPVSGIWGDAAPMGWAQAFGQYARHDSDGMALSFAEHTYGAIAGHDQRIGNHRAGFFGGVAQSRMDTRFSSAKTDSHAAFAGIYGQMATDNWLFNGSLTIGYADYNGTRQVTDNLAGMETARADYHGWFLSPSLSVARIFDQGGGFSLRPSAELNYAYGQLSSYSETGTTRSNLSVGSRTAEVLNTRLQLAARQELDDKKGEIEGRAGFSHTNYGNDVFAVALPGMGSTRYGMTGTGSVTGAYAGVGTRLHCGKNLSLFGDVEYFHSSSSDKTIAGYVGLEYRF